MIAAPGINCNQLQLMTMIAVIHVRIYMQALRNDCIFAGKFEHLTAIIAVYYISCNQNTSNMIAVLFYQGNYTI